MTNEQIIETMNKAKEHFAGRDDINAAQYINALVEMIEDTSAGCKDCDE